MSSGQFAAFLDDGSDSDSDQTPTEPLVNESGHIPSYEDLSTSRTDEETVLWAVYGPDFSREDGPWGCAKLQVQVRPPDMDLEHIGSQLKLSVQLGKQYPYVIPTVELHNVKGLSKKEQSTLHQKLKERALELASGGSVMVCELVQLTEDFLLEHNQDPTMSAWEQMKAREAKEKAEKEKIEQERNTELQMLIQAENSSNNPYSTAMLSPENSRNVLSSFGQGCDSSNVERELARQREAMDTAKSQRMKIGSLFERISSDEVDCGEAGDVLRIDDGYENDDDFDDEDNGPPAALVGYSRYKTDFIELGVLGRGGGGEVVKVRNRLDRRTCKCNNNY
jgi:translation initiation factor 2-alpha kinase 4